MAKGVEISGLNVSGGSGKLLSDINLKVAPGEIYALAGGDGAAKRVLLRTVAAMLQGTGAVENDSLLKGGAPGVVPEKCVPFGFMRVMEYMNYVYCAAGGKKEIRIERIKGLLDITGLTARARAKVSSLKPVEVKLLNIALALYPSPDILIIGADDLPADKSVKTKLDAALAGIKRMGKTVLISLPPALCGKSVDKIGIFHDGKIIAEGTPESLLNLLPDVVTLEGEGNLPALAKKLRKSGGEGAEKNRITLRAGKLNVYSKSGGAAGRRVLELAEGEEIAVGALRLRRPSIAAAAKEAVKKCGK